MFWQWLKNSGQTKITQSASVDVLIIEDNKVDSEMIRRAVEICGFNSLIAYDGKTGFELARKHLPEVIILDYHLPDTNGGHVLKKLRSNKETSLETVIVLSALDRPGIIMDSFSNGADQYLTKPISIAELAKQIRYMYLHPHSD